MVGGCTNQVILALVLSALPTGAPAGLAGQQNVSEATTELLRLEQALAETLHTRDRGTMERLLADDFALRSTPDVDRSVWMQNALTRCWGDRADISEFGARLFDRTAVASFVLTLYVDPATCAPATSRSLITDIWIERDGRWRLLVRHSGPAPAGPGIADQYALVPEVPPAWTLDGEFSLVATAGNSPTRTLGLGSTFARRTDTSATRVHLAFVTNETDDVTRARSLAAEARHGRRFSPRIELFAKTAYARDRFAGIAGRRTIESGLAYTPALPPAHVLSLEASAGVTWEDRLTSDDLRFAVASGVIAYDWKIAPNTELEDDLTVTGDLSAARNWRATNTLSARVAISRLFSLRLTQAIEYRNFPVPGFKRADMRTAAALVFAYQRR